MPIIFPTSNLPTASWPWARQVEKSISTLDTFTSQNEINNTARDNQLSSSLVQVSKAAKDAATAAANAQAAATKAQTALDALGALDEATSTYKISASNVTVGTLSGNRISGGTITGTILETATSGRRVKISGTTATFYDESGNYSGTITVAGYGNEAVMTVNGPFTSRSISFSSVNTYISGGGGTYINLNDAPQIVLGGNISVVGSYSVPSQTNNPIIGPNGGMYPNLATSSVAGTPVQWRGANQVMFGNTSARKYKLEIEDEDYGDIALSLQPKSWIDKTEYEENGNSSEGLKRQHGFIAEEVSEIGLDFFVLRDYNTGEIQSISYDRLPGALVSLAKIQQSKITELESRIQQLEGK